MATLAEIASALISVFEGPDRLVAYADTGWVWTIGRGHTKGVKQGDTCTPSQSVAWFAEDQAPLLEMVDGVKFWRAAAYVSFGFNCGRGALHAVLTGTDTIDNPKHTTDRHGNVLAGLMSRRRLEKLLAEDTD